MQSHFTVINKSNYHLQGNLTKHEPAQLYRSPGFLVFSPVTSLNFGTYLRHVKDVWRWPHSCFIAVCGMQKEIVPDLRAAVSYEEASYLWRNDVTTVGGALRGFLENLVGHVFIRFLNLFLQRNILKIFQRALDRFEEWLLGFRRNRDNFRRSSGSYWSVFLSAASNPHSGTGDFCSHLARASGSVLFSNDPLQILELIGTEDVGIGRGNRVVFNLFGNFIQRKWRWNSSMTSKATPSSILFWPFSCSSCVHRPIFSGHAWKSTVKQLRTVTNGSWAFSRAEIQSNWAGVYVCV